MTVQDVFRCTRHRIAGRVSVVVSDPSASRPVFRDWLGRFVLGPPQECTRMLLVCEALANQRVE